MKRTHTCGDLKAADIDKEVTLSGWVQNRRDHGGVLFIDLRDRYGLTQVVFDPDEVGEYMEAAQALRGEWVVQIKGVVRPRPEGTVNPKMTTGEIEVRTKELTVLSKAQTPPFEIDDFSESNEELRLKYRYLDMRRSRMQNTFITRHKVYQAVRKSLNEQDFLEFETPILAKSTPEGARDYLVPSRVHPGEFYALPQSPQIFKQILMVSGFDRYFQICRCFRDEDLRADRQPEFTQIDIEMSFADAEDVMTATENIFKKAFKVIDVDLQTPFPKMPYKEAMEKYGTDKPDLRFGLELTDVGDLVKGCDFKVFSGALDRGGVVKAIRGPKMNAWSRKQMDDLAKLVAIHGAKGLAYIKIDDAGEYGGPIVKFFAKETIDAIKERLGAENGDCIMFGADDVDIVLPSLALLRNHLGKELELYDPKEFNFVWVVEFPLFDWSEEDKRWTSTHHPFTMPYEEDIPLLDKLAAGEKDVFIRSDAYDLALNGVEVGGGSVRIHNSEVQEKIFRALNISEEDIKERFGFFVEALKYGTPPHAGLAVGLDRMVAMMLGYENIREVIAFPKTQKATCLMSDAPGEVEAKQVRELGLSIRKPEAKPESKKE